MTRFFRILSFALLFSAGAIAQAAVPATLYYQGQLANAAGVPVNTAVNITFKLYDVAGGGTALWSEAQSIAVSNGSYGATLGQTTPLAPALFGVPLYLGITVGTDAEITPRIAMTSSATALRAQLADSISCTGCILASNIASGSITATQIAPGAISASSIAPGSITSAQLAPGAIFTWVDVTGTTQQAASNTGYMADNAARVTITLPAAPAVGDIVKVVGIGAGGWNIVQNAGQSTVAKNLYAISGVSATTALAAQISGGQDDAIELMYKGNNQFTVLNNAGNLVVVAVPSAPTARYLNITGIAMLDQTLTGNYSYFDVNGDPQGASTFRWLRNGAAITGATSSTYKQVAADVGNTLTFEVTPVSTMVPTTGIPVVSAATTTVLNGFVSQGGLTWMPVTFTKNWADANTYCTTTTINGQTGWRLPTSAELSALYTSGAMNGQGWALSITWSSTPNGVGNHYYVSLGIGGVFTSIDTNYNYVTCVR